MKKCQHLRRHYHTESTHGFRYEEETQSTRSLFSLKYMVISTIIHMDKMEEADEDIFVHYAQIYPHERDDLERNEENRAILRLEDGIDMGKIDM